VDKKGQIALEYLLLFFIVLIILSVISVPLLMENMELTTDMTTSVEVKSFLTEVGKNVKLMYSMEKDSKRTFSVYVPCNMTLYYNKYSNGHFLSTTIILSDTTRKNVKLQVPCDVSFSGYINNHNVRLEKSWYYNTEVKWYTSRNGTRSINVNFK
jgi:uncharacterized protein (UPF0333 family)